jgi:hypothetical protein
LNMPFLSFANKRSREMEELKSQLQSLTQERDSLSDRLAKFGEGPPFVPNGHFYSPIASLGDIQRDEKRIFAEWPRTLPDIDLREPQQVALLEEIAAYYDDLPFRDEAVPGLRYKYDNPAYSYCDSIILNGMLRKVRPKRLIEIGSGYSSCMTLDTNEIWFNNAIECTFIEPYPELLLSLIKPEDKDRIVIHPSRVQDVDLKTFEQLQSGDVLFIDSTHVGKTGSDVNFLFFEVFPVLAEGVNVHIHDIFYPFEYPRSWVELGVGWNEQYLLRAILQNNSNFEITFFNTFLMHFHRKFYEERMPMCLRNNCGSIWLRKSKK